MILYFVVYTLITLYFISDIRRDQSASLGYLFIFPTFWIIAALALVVLLWLKKVAISTLWDKLLVGLSTPIPLLLGFFIFSRLTSAGLLISSAEYNKDGRSYREMRSDYAPGKPQRVEYYVSSDTISELEPVPTSDIWLKDCIWIIYNKDGTVK